MLTKNRQLLRYYKKWVRLLALKYLQGFNLSLAYIFVVNPAILGRAGINTSVAFLQPRILLSLRS